MFLWLIPVGVALTFLSVSEKTALELVAACIAAVLFVFMINRPTGTMWALVVFLPSELVLFPLLHKWGVPGTFLHQASAIKEMMGLAILVAGLRVLRDSGQKLDKIDIAVLLYVGVVTIYLLAPHAFSTVAPTEWSARFLAWRSDAGYPLIFLGARHAPFSQKTREQFLQLVLIVGGFIAVVGLYQKVAASSFSNFILNTAGVENYEQYVLNTPLTVVQRNLAYIHTISPLHISSILLSPYDMGDYMAVVAAIAAVRISQHHRSVFYYLVFASCAASCYFTQVRADSLAIVVVLVFVALPASRTPLEGRLRLIATLAVAAVLVVPAIGSSRFFNKHDTVAQQSSTGHVKEIQDGIDVMIVFPLGLGLGQQPGVANRYVQLTGLLLGGDISDNVITQVGDELGVQALIPWLVMVFLIGLELKRRAGRGDEVAACMGFAFVAIFVAGQFHHVFLTFPLPWMLWAGLGLALTRYEAPQQAYAPGDSGSLEAGPGPSAAGVR